MATGDRNRRDLFVELYGAMVDFAGELRQAADAGAPTNRQPPAEPDQRPRLRPPGALDEAVFSKLCTSCADCAEACPHGAIELLGEANHDAGMPLIDPSKKPCHLCDGFPCAAACSRGALIRPSSGTWRFGTVRIEAQQCFTFRGPECGACGGLCPTDEPALTFERNRPRVDLEACVGCGLCVEACPTLPAAIVFET